MGPRTPTECWWFYTLRGARARNCREPRIRAPRAATVGHFVRSTRCCEGLENPGWEDEDSSALYEEHLRAIVESRRIGGQSEDVLRFAIANFASDPR